jgi:class 3 adenylate cyclase
MPIGDWLRRIGLSQYEAKFREHDIDADVLAALSEDDIKRLGVAFGSCKRLMQAIADLGPAAKSAQAVPPTAVERRPITILFCELDGSALASRYDIEDWRDIRGPYLDAVASRVMRFGGHILNSLDDRLMAAFGYPRAQENDAERAVPESVTEPVDR